jgi:hypothetical protein
MINTPPWLRRSWTYLSSDSDPLEASASLHPRRPWRSRESRAPILSNGTFDEKNHLSRARSRRFNYAAFKFPSLHRRLMSPRSHSRRMFRLISQLHHKSGESGTGLTRRRRPSCQAAEESVDYFPSRVSRAELMRAISPCCERDRKGYAW